MVNRLNLLPKTMISLLACGLFLLLSGSAHSIEPLFYARIDYAAGDYPWSVFSIDLDGDGDNDLATANQNSDNVSILLNNGDGTFQSAVNYAAGDGPWSVFSIDIDGDGDNDLATANENSDNVSILFNLTDPQFGCCEVPGDGDHNTSVDISDLTYLVDYMFDGGADPNCSY